MPLTAGTGDEVAISESGGQNPDKHKTDKTQTAEEVEEVVAVETALAIAATDEVVKAVVAKVAALEVDVVATKITAALEVDVVATKVTAALEVDGVATKVTAESEVLVTVRIEEERKDERKTTTNTSADNGIANADRRQQRFSNPTFVPKIVQQKKSQKQMNKTAVEEAQCEKAEQPMKADSVIIHSAMIADSKSADVQEDNIKSFAIEAPVVPDVAQVVAHGDRCNPLKLDDDDRRGNSKNNTKNGKLNRKQGYCNNHNDDSKRSCIKLNFMKGGGIVAGVQVAISNAVSSDTVSGSGSRKGCFQKQVQETFSKEPRLVACLANVSEGALTATSVQDAFQISTVQGYSSHELGTRVRTEAQDLKSHLTFQSMAKGILKVFLQDS
jgi:hypothetical protein